MPRFLSALFLLTLSFTLWGQSRCVVLDSLSRAPLPKATIFDNEGRVVALTSDKGVIPYVSASAYPITIRYIGYEPVTVAAPGAYTVLMNTAISDLPEMVVTSRKNQILHMLAYVREFSTLTTYSDTVFLFREKVVDYMLPDRAVRRFSGWSTPRVIASKSYYHFTNSEGLDSVSDAFPEHFSWCDWIGVIKSADLPLTLRDTTCATDTTMAKYTPAIVWRRYEDKAELDIDVLADRENYKWVPAIRTYLDTDMDFRRLDLKYAFHNVSDTVVTAKNISAYSFHIESNGRGRNLKRLFDSPGPAYVDTYAEVYVVDSEYISVREARKWEGKHMASNQIDIELPPYVPDLDVSVHRLIDRVEKVNHGYARLFVKPDHRLGREQKRRGFLKYLKAMLGIYSSKVNYQMPSRTGNKKSEAEK